jgi:hypothetical protein
MAWQLTHSPHVDHLLGEPWCRKLRRRVAQIKVTDHVVPTVRTSAGHRCCLAGDDQGQPAALHHQLRCGDITATMPKVVDDHLDYGGTLAYLTRCPTNQDGVVIEKLVSNGASLSMQASSSIASRSSGDSAPAGTSDTRKPNRAARPMAWCARSRPSAVLGGHRRQRCRVVLTPGQPAEQLLDSAWCDYLQDAQLCVSGIPECVPMPAAAWRAGCSHQSASPARTGRHVRATLCR